MQLDQNNEWVVLADSIDWSRCRSINAGEGWIGWGVHITEVYT